MSGLSLIGPQRTSYGFQLSPWKVKEGGGSSFGTRREAVACSLMQRRLASITPTLTHPMGVVMAESGTNSNTYLHRNREMSCHKRSSFSILE